MASGKKRSLKALNAMVHRWEVDGVLDQRLAGAVRKAVDKVRRAVQSGRPRDIEASLNSLCRLFLRISNS